MTIWKLLEHPRNCVGLIHAPLYAWIYACICGCADLLLARRLPQQDTLQAVDAVQTAAADLQLAEAGAEQQRIPADRRCCVDERPDVLAAGQVRPDELLRSARGGLRLLRDEE